MDITKQLPLVKGTIVRADDNGLGYVRVGKLPQLVSFTFDKIVGYRGESARQLKLRPGSTVELQFVGPIDFGGFDANGAVSDISLEKVFVAR